MIARPFRPDHADDAATWDALCAQSPHATFLHTRQFLRYHGDRFDDRSLVIVDDAGHWLGVIPAALDPHAPTTVVSHPGLSYGGLVHTGGLRGEPALTALQAACHTWADQGLHQLLYKPVPSLYHQAPAQDDLYALFRLQATRSRCSLSCTVDLHAPDALNWRRSERRRRSIRQAAKAGITYDCQLGHLPAYWAVLSDNLARKHGRQPVHSLAEISWLAERFGEHIACHVAMHANEVVAGIVTFTHGHVVHAQYIAASAQGHALSALDGLIDHLIALSREAGHRYFDFGICDEQQGQHLNEGLYRFKAEFGAGGTVQEFYTVPLR